MHDSSSRHAAPSGPTHPVWVTGRADSGLGVREAQPQGFFFCFFFPLQAVISMETQTAVESGCLRSFYFSFSLRVTWSVCSVYLPPVVCSRAPGHAGAGCEPEALCSSFKSLLGSSLFPVVSQICCDWDFLFFCNLASDDVSK